MGYFVLLFIFVFALHQTSYNKFAYAFEIEMPKFDFIYSEWYQVKFIQVAVK